MNQPANTNEPFKMRSLSSVRVQSAYDQCEMLFDTGKYHACCCGQHTQVLVGMNQQGNKQFYLA